MQATHALLFSFALLFIVPAQPSIAQDLFESRIRPILVNRCFMCHTDAESGGLRLDSRESMLKGGRSGPAIFPGDPEKSLLIAAVRQTGELKIAEGRQADPAHVDAFVEWVKSGATWGDLGSAALTAAATKGDTVSPERRAFWSFEPLHPAHAPGTKDAAWAKNDIDRFILGRLEKEGLSPVPAYRRTLLRRATLDLIGLPPTPEEIEAFEKDKSPDAFAKVVDRLMASPHYGERWARFWLDVARYGEDDYRSLDPMGRGYAPYENAFTYRDWLVRAFLTIFPMINSLKLSLPAI